MDEVQLAIGEGIGEASCQRAPVHSIPGQLAPFVYVVVLVGIALIVDSILRIGAAATSPYFWALALVTIVSGRFAIKVPGRSATVSVSEVFVFAGVILLGTPSATLIVAIDGLCASLLQRHRRLYRTLFNVTEPALSTWAAARVYFLFGEPAGLAGHTSTIVMAAIAMAAVFFVLNSGLTAVAIGLESETSAFETWRRHAKALAANYYAAASVAALAVTTGGHLNGTVAALAVPLLILSYLAYKEASERVDEAHRHITEVGHLYHATTEMLAIAVDAKDQVTHGHIRRVQRYTLAVARALGVADESGLKAIEAGALLHDIGKLAVPDFVLNKPSALTRSEFEVIKSHATMGARILNAVEFPYPVVPIVRHHHEQWNGRGYPDGLAGKEIPLGARIIAVVDCYDALTSDRPYRPRLEVASAIELLRSRKGTFYDPDIVETLIKLLPALQLTEAATGNELKMPVGGLIRAAEFGLFSGDTAPIPVVPDRVHDLIDAGVDRLDDAHACLFLVNDTGDALGVAHATGRIRRFVGTLQLSLGTSVSGWVAANRSTIRDAQAALDLGGTAERAGVRWCTSTPVFADGNAVGALTLYRRSEPDRSEAVAASAAVLAHQIGLALSRSADVVQAFGASSTTVPVREWAH